MAFINQPPDLRALFEDLNDRLRKLETAVRFTSPNVSTDPTNPRTGDIWYNTASNILKTLLTTTATIVTREFANTFTALQTFAAGLTVSSGNLGVTTGNITASAGSISAGTTLSAGTTVTGGTGVIATTGDITSTAGNLVATAGGVNATSGTVSAANLTSTGTTTVGTFNFSTTGTATTIGAAGGASALPATPLGYLIIKVGGTDRKIPYYNM
jgi:hypothetical protein